jgi:N6-L-threonylcarbamoyladenine synthase
LIAVNHLEGHALTVRLTDGVAFPYLLLLVSGGHCQLVTVEGAGEFDVLGSTIDDAAGEAFDKVAKLLGLPYPGGPNIEALAKDGDPKAFSLPRPMVGRERPDFSFSGLKTAVRHIVHGPEFQPRRSADLAASFQAALIQSVVDRVRTAITLFRRRHPQSTATLVVAGGVAANKALGDALTQLAQSHGFAVRIPPPQLCTDNAAMIAWAGVERCEKELFDGLDTGPKARWPLAQMHPGTGHDVP